LIGQSSPAKTASQEIKVSKAAVLSGRILDTKSKVPIAGALVTAGPARMMMGPGRADFSTTAATDAKGSYSLIVLPGSYRLVASHPSYDTKTTDASALGGQTASKDLVLTPYARVTGVVYDESNRPVAGATITTEDPGEGGFPPRMMRFLGSNLEAASGPDGRFAIRFAGDEDLRLKAAKKGLPSAKSETLKLVPGERKSGVVLTMPSGVAVSGKVTDRDGKPLSGVTVSTAEAEPGRAGMQRIMISNILQFDDDAVTTSSDGTFSLRLKEGTYDFTFKREGYATQNTRAQAVTASGTNVVDAKLEPAVEIRGRVVRNGTGVDGVIVMAMVQSSDARTTTGPDGSFTLGGLTPGQTRVTARKDDEFVQEMRSFTAPASDVVIDLPAGSRVSGRVVEKGSSKAVTQFQAGLSRSRSAGGMVMMAPPQLKAFTSQDGSFVLEHVPSGAHDLVASAAGYASGRLNVNVEEGKELSGLVIELDTGTRLTGKVTGPNGSPLPDVRVNMAMGPGSAVARMGNVNATVTDANGEYSIEGLESGEEVVEFTHAKYIGTKKDVSLKGREIRLDVQLEGGQRVSGVVVTEAGVPVADADVYASAAGGSRRSAHTNASGMFEFESLAPARYRFAADKTGFAGGQVDDFDIASGAPLRITLKTGGTIYGRVTGLAPTEFSNVLVQANGLGSSASASVDSAGNYRIEGAPTGTVRVSAMVSSSGFAMGRNTGTQTVELEPGSSQQLDLEFKGDTVIKGRVTRNGAPLKGANIMFMPKNSRSQASAGGSTDDDGSYSVMGLEEGEYNVTVVDMQRLSPYTTTYQVRGSSTFDIAFKANALRGHVLDATNNVPLPDTAIQIRSNDASDGFRGVRSVSTDSTGTFILENVSPGSYTLTAVKEGYAAEPRDLMVGDRGGDEIEIKLAKNDGVIVKIIDARDGHALQGGVTVFDAQGRFAGEKGGFSFFGGSEGSADAKVALPPGHYTATVTAPRYAPRTISFDAPSTQTVGLTPGGTLVLRSKRSTPSRVRLVDANGQPYPRTNNRPMWYELNPSPGASTIEHIAPGTYTVQVLGDGDVVLDSIRVTIGEAQTTNEEI
jgi:protocatechuate 3,4-dioxygenase beta subunit